MNGRGRARVRIPPGILACDRGGGVTGEGSGGGDSGTISRTSGADHVAVVGVELSVEGVAGRSVWGTRPWDL